MDALDIIDNHKTVGFMTINKRIVILHYLLLVGGRLKRTFSISAN